MAVVLKWWPVVLMWPASHLFVDWQERLFFLHSHLSSMLIYTFSMYATHWWLVYVHYCKWQYVEYCTFSSCFHLLIQT